MLCGFPPFYNDNNEALFESIKSAKYDFPSPYWDDISAAAKDLICKCLVINPQERIDAEGILNHPWITNAEEVPEVDLTQVPPKLKEFNAKRRWKRGATAIIALNRLKKKMMI